MRSSRTSRRKRANTLIRIFATHTIVNGCGIGYNEYANEKLRAPYTRPTQALWFTHPEYGVTCQWPIYLEKKQTSLSGKAEWVRWAGNSGSDLAA